MAILFILLLSINVSKYFIFSFLVTFLVQTNRDILAILLSIWNESYSIGVEFITT